MKKWIGLSLVWIAIFNISTFCIAKSTQSTFVPQKRTITIENNCPEQMFWGITGTAIQTNGNPIACPTAGQPCSGWAGSNPGDAGICGEDNR